MKLLLDRVLVFINRKLCRHREMIKKFTRNRVYLQCMSCPYQTPGFKIDEVM